MISEERLLRSVKGLIRDAAPSLGLPVSMQLWDNEIIPLGNDADPSLYFSISGPGVVGALLRRPTLENFVRHYARGQIDFHGADFMTFAERCRVRGSRELRRKIGRWNIVRRLAPFLFLGADKHEADYEWSGDETGRNRVQEDNKDYIQFHYDIGNDFYKLFLDERMVYTCAYFTDWNNSLEQAQYDKMEMVCRKLQLKPGERMLDIGCGWGAMVIHAAQNYGVKAHGVTLSQEQVTYAREKIRDLGLEGRASVELIDYTKAQGTYDKVCSIGMVEHVGIANMPQYVQTIKELMPDRGIFLNHGITRPAKASKKLFHKIRPEQRLLAKYIFPGGELDHIGNTIACMESGGFRIHDVEGWRDHYALTCRHWCNRLWHNREEATRQVGRERFRLWLAYLGCVSFSLGDGSACLFQTVATRHASRGHSTVPPTREFLYEDWPQQEQSEQRAA